MKELPREIGNLINLKSLYIKSANLKELPKEIKNLVNLERIDIIWDGYAKGLPNEILNFEKLKFIEIKKLGFIYKSVGREYKIEKAKKKIKKNINKTKK